MSGPKETFNPNRRRFLAAAGCALAVGGGAYTYVRGVRFPLLHFTADGPVTRWSGDGIEVVARGASFQTVENDALRFRAFVPEPAFTVRGNGKREAGIVLENVHTGAGLVPDYGNTNPGSLDEERDNLTRKLVVRPDAGTETGLSWRFPNPEQYRFAAIGDTGGGTELRWVLERASALGADFLIHLGDIHYEAGDFSRAEVNLNTADMPTYAAIGNHDFHLGLRALYPEFNRIVGPSNSKFELGGVEFVNLDTAADFYPAVRGRRAAILQGLEAVGDASGIRDRVAFTHKPLSDPDTERDHAVDRAAERRWLRDELLSRGTRTLLAGHIHIKEVFDDQGLNTYITGQGLAHADLIVGRPYAEILLGDVEPGAPVRFQWQPLQMPFEAHCNERNMRVLDMLERPEVKEKLLAQCGKA